MMTVTITSRTVLLSSMTGRFSVTLQRNQIRRSLLRWLNTVIAAAKHGLLVCKTNLAEWLTSFAQHPQQSRTQRSRERAQSRLVRSTLARSHDLHRCRCSAVSTRRRLEKDEWFGCVAPNRG